jgi:hypothetical protein
VVSDNAATPPQHAGLAERGARGGCLQHRLARQERGQGEDLPAVSVAAASTAAFAASTSGRLGTAANVARISPGENSEVTVSTPSAGRGGRSPSRRRRLIG